MQLRGGIANRTLVGLVLRKLVLSTAKEGGQGWPKARRVYRRDGSSRPSGESTD